MAKKKDTAPEAEEDAAPWGSNVDWGLILLPEFLRHDVPPEQSLAKGKKAIPEEEWPVPLRLYLRRTMLQQAACHQVKLRGSDGKLTSVPSLRSFCIDFLKRDYDACGQLDALATCGVEVEVTSRARDHTSLRSTLKAAYDLEIKASDFEADPVLDRFNSGMQPRDFDTYKASCPRNMRALLAHYLPPIRHLTKPMFLGEKIHDPCELPRDQYQGASAGAVNYYLEQALAKLPESEFVDPKRQQWYALDETRLLAETAAGVVENFDPKRESSLTSAVAAATEAAYCGKSPLLVEHMPGPVQQCLAELMAVYKKKLVRDGLHKADAAPSFATISQALGCTCDLALQVALLRLVGLPLQKGQYYPLTIQSFYRCAVGEDLFDAQGRLKRVPKRGLAPKRDFATAFGDGTTDSKRRKTQDASIAGTGKEADSGVPIPAADAPAAAPDSHPAVAQTGPSGTHNAEPSDKPPPQAEDGVGTEAKGGTPPAASIPNTDDASTAQPIVPASQEEGLPDNLFGTPPVYACMPDWYPRSTCIPHQEFMEQYGLYGRDQCQIRRVVRDLAQITRFPVRDMPLIDHQIPAGWCCLSDLLPREVVPQGCPPGVIVSHEQAIDAYWERWTLELDNGELLYANRPIFLAMTEVLPMAACTKRGQRVQSFLHAIDTALARDPPSAVPTVRLNDPKNSRSLSAALAYTDTCRDRGYCALRSRGTGRFIDSARSFIDTSERLTCLADLLATQGMPGDFLQDALLETCMLLSHTLVLVAPSVPDPKNPLTGRYAPVVNPSAPEAGDWRQLVPHACYAPLLSRQAGDLFCHRQQLWNEGRQQAVCFDHPGTLSRAPSPAFRRDA